MCIALRLGLCSHATSIPCCCAVQQSFHAHCCTQYSSLIHHCNRNPSIPRLYPDIIINRHVIVLCGSHSCGQYLHTLRMQQAPSHTRCDSTAGNQNELNSSTHHIYLTTHTLQPPNICLLGIPPCLPFAQPCRDTTLPKRNVRCLTTSSCVWLMRAQLKLQRQQLQQSQLPAADQLTPIPSCWNTNIHCSSLARALLHQPRQQQQLLPAHHQPFLAGAPGRACTTPPLQKALLLPQPKQQPLLPAPGRACTTPPVQKALQQPKLQQQETTASLPPALLGWRSCRRRCCCRHWHRLWLRQGCGLWRCWLLLLLLLGVLAAAAQVLADAADLVTHLQAGRSTVAANDVVDTTGRQAQCE
jgi:hypothetical protein